MTNDEIAQAVQTLVKLQSSLQDIAAQRKAEEDALNAEYLVYECNQKKNDLALKYTALAQPTVDQIQTLRASLGI